MQKEFRLHFLVPVANIRFRYSMFSSSWSLDKEHTVNIALQMPYIFMYWNRNGRLGYPLPFYGQKFTHLCMCIILYLCNELESNSKVNFPGHLDSFQIAKLRKSNPSHKCNNASWYLHQKSDWPESSEWLTCRYHPWILLNHDITVLDFFGFRFLLVMLTTRFKIFS